MLNQQYKRISGSPRLAVLIVHRFDGLKVGRGKALLVATTSRLPASPGAGDLKAGLPLGLRSKLKPEASTLRVL